MKISLGSWAFSFGPYADAPVSFARIAERLAEAGYDGIEICGFPPHLTLEAYPTRESRLEAARSLAGLGLGVSGYSADLTAVNPVTPGRKQKYLDLFARNLEMCVDLGSPAIRVDSVAAPGSLDDQEYAGGFGRLAETWHDAAALAAPAGVRVVWEFEPGFLFNKPSEVLSLHRDVQHPNFAILFDTAHAYVSGVVGARQHPPRETVPGGVTGFLKMLEGRVGAVHLVDSDGTLYGDETSTHCAFGEGKIDFAALAPALAALPGVEWWCVDLCFRADGWDLIAPSLAYVRALCPPMR